MMKSFFPFVLLLVLLILAMVIEELLPAMAFLGEAHIILIPIVFCFGALALPLPEALLFAIITGVFQGLSVLQIQNDTVEIKLFWFILFFMIWTLCLQFASDLMSGIRWELHSLGSALCTATLLFGEFILLSWARGHFGMTGTTFYLIVIPFGAAFLLAPFFYLFLQFLLPPAKPLRATTSLPL